jgi:hypothetical protein
MPLSPSDLHELRQAREQLARRSADARPGEEASSFPDGSANAG